MVNTAALPQIRLVLYSLLTIASLLLFVMSVALLGYQLTKTAGYNKPVPALVVVGATVLLHCVVFAFFPPPSTASTKRLRLQALVFEIPSLCFLGLFSLAAIARLHSSTPGLYSSCKGYVTCTMLQGCLALGWLTFLFTATLFVLLFLATLYHHRRSHSASIWRSPFAFFDWAVYAPRVAGGRRGVPMSGGGGETGHRKSGSVQLV